MFWESVQLENFPAIQKEKNPSTYIFSSNTVKRICFS